MVLSLDTMQIFNKNFHWTRMFKFWPEVFLSWPKFETVHSSADVSVSAMSQYQAPKTVLLVKLCFLVMWSVKYSTSENDLRILTSANNSLLRPLWVAARNRKSDIARHYGKTRILLEKLSMSWMKDFGTTYKREQKSNHTSYLSKWTTLIVRGVGGAGIG